MQRVGKCMSIEYTDIGSNIARVISAQLDDFFVDRQIVVC